MMGDPAWFRARARASRYARYLALKTALSIARKLIAVSMSLRELSLVQGEAREAEGRAGGIRDAKEHRRDRVDGAG